VYSGSSRWRLRPSPVAGVSGCRAGRRVCGGDGQKCGVEAQGQTSHAPSPQAFARSGKTEHLYREANYAAKTWPQERRIIIKAEVVQAAGKEPKDNPRFVITNLKQSPQWIYEKVYCQRGEIENRIKGAPAKPARSRW